MNLVTHLAGVSERGSFSIDNEVSACDECRREPWENVLLIDPTILRSMRLTVDGPSSDMMIRRHCSGLTALPTFYIRAAYEFVWILIFCANYATWLLRRGPCWWPYSSLGYLQRVEDELVSQPFEDPLLTAADVISYSALTRCNGFRIERHHSSRWGRRKRVIEWEGGHWEVIEVLRTQRRVPVLLKPFLSSDLRRPCVVYGSVIATA